MLFGQSFDTPDLAVIGLLIVLEGVLSIDNALVLGLLAKRLPKDQQKKALTYGLIGAFAFRVIAIAMVSLLLKWWWIKLIGGGYLLYVAVKHFYFDTKHEPDRPADEVSAAADTTHSEVLTPDEREKEIAERSPVVLKDAASANPRAELSRYAAFWPTVAVIELTDIAFAVDSILAAMAMIPAVPPSMTNPKLWVVITGGMIGVILMRFAAVLFIKLLEKFPRLEVSAYLLVLVIGAKLVVDWFFNKPPTTGNTDWHAPVNFHAPSSPAFWFFWTAMVVCFGLGFAGRKKGMRGEA